MPERKKDPEIAALEALHAALKPLDSEARRKVLASVYALLEIPGTAPGSGEERIPRTPLPPRSMSPRPVSLVELMQDKLPGASVQRLTLFAYYREKFEGLSRFGRDDLKGYFQKAKEPPPANYDRDFHEAVRKGWLHEEGDDSYITSKGIETVEAGFPGERKRFKRAGTRSRQNAKGGRVRGKSSRA
ncbi:MAG: hypothetical protein IH847_08030 [Acidobacteria bacterium]|nr:hypothetical protein [Acidobacteriota bacterium]